MQFAGLSFVGHFRTDDETRMSGCQTRYQSHRIQRLSGAQPPVSLPSPVVELAEEDACKGETSLSASQKRVAGFWVHKHVPQNGVRRFQSVK